MTWSNRAAALGLGVGVAAMSLSFAYGCDSDDNNTPNDDSAKSSSSSASGGTGGAGGAGGDGAGAANCSVPEGVAPLGDPVKLTDLAIPIADPVLVTHAPGDGDRVFILEQPGRIQILNGGNVTTFLDITSSVQSGGEQGLLGLAFHPDYQTNGRFFVHYSASGNVTTVQEFARDGDNPDVANPAPVGEPYFTFNQPYGNHNGGSIEFGRNDGFLYIGLGDGGAANDPLNSGQDLSSPLGTLLRLDVSTNPPTNPPGNLTGDVDGRIFDSGLRNPYRFSFDACTGDRYIGDVGQDEWEEIDVASATQGATNWGWRLKEGNNCFNPSSDCDPGNVTATPAVEYGHFQGCSVTGGYVYRGSNIPWLRGAYIYGDYCSGRIWMFRWNNGTISDDQLLIDMGGSFNISCFGQDANGEMYVCKYDGEGSFDGIYRIDPP